jgi:choline kinase|tara:strand:- start:12781 stop:12972 length:192 start_codon:yes stop_codon:yes gene_type:complete
MLVGNELMGIVTKRFNNEDLNSYIAKINMFPVSIMYNKDYEMKNIVFKIILFEKYELGITMSY